MQRIVKKMRQEGTLQSKPRALASEDEPLMSILWENTEPKEKVENTHDPPLPISSHASSITPEAPQSASTSSLANAYKTVSKGVVQGLVLQGHVHEYVPCKNCYEDIITL
jgi:hypothetical protein